MKTILVADDSLFMRTVIKDIVGGKYAVIEADSGRRCVELYERARPDLVLLDVVMPEGDEEGQGKNGEPESMFEHLLHSFR